MDDILGEFTKQALDAYYNGVCDAWTYLFSLCMGLIFVVLSPKTSATSFAPLVPASAKDINGTRVRLVCIGVKGDWPFLRKVS